jgi:hypothetical protein
LGIACPADNTSLAKDEAEGVRPDAPRRGVRAERYFFGAFGSLGVVLELSLGFIVLSPVPGALEVSVVEPVCVLSTGPVAGAAGRV